MDEKPAGVLREVVKWVGLAALIITLAIAVDTLIPVLGGQLAMGIATGLVLLVAYATRVGRDRKST